MEAVLFFGFIFVVIGGSLAAIAIGVYAVSPLYWGVEKIEKVPEQLVQFLGALAAAPLAAIPFCLGYVNHNIRYYPGGVYTDEHCWLLFPAAVLCLFVSRKYKGFRLVFLVHLLTTLAIAFSREAWSGFSPGFG
jgi:hypothetical protein